MTIELRLSHSHNFEAHTLTYRLGKKETPKARCSPQPRHQPLSFGRRCPGNACWSACHLYFARVSPRAAAPRVCVANARSARRLARSTSSDSSPSRRARSTSSRQTAEHTDRVFRLYLQNLIEDMKQLIINGIVMALEKHKT